MLGALVPFYKPNDESNEALDFTLRGERSGREVRQMK
jgi:hypothetical protein